MRKINEEPREVFRFFEEISAIPRGSGNTEAISDYLVSFARDRQLRYVRDALNNVVIFADGTTGYEGADPVIIQGHMDMVCEKDPDSDKDLEKDGLDLYVEDGFVKARGTTLGGDDGIAIAYALALMDGDAPHPPIEAVFTVDEEVGMGGASGFDASVLRGRAMLNIDSEQEGVFTVSCAGGANVNVMIPTEREFAKGRIYEIVIDGLKGGHSGMEINKGLGNSNILMGRLLYFMRDNIKIIKIDGGSKGNAIPSRTMAAVMSDMHIEETAVECENIFRHELELTDPDIRVICSYKGEGEALVCTETEKLMAFLIMAPNGICSMRSDIEGLVETSLNLGIVSLHEDKMTALYTIRSSMRSHLRWLCQRIDATAKSLNGEIIVNGIYLPWEYKANSLLRQLMTEIYREQYGREPVIEAIHAGLECGIFAGKISGLDAVSIGPDLHDIHTTRERMDIASVGRTWNFIKEILKRSK